MKKTFEENDAGFRYILQIKGQNAYDYINKITLEKAEKATTKHECIAALLDWLHFFRHGHIGIISLQDKNEKPQQTKPIDTVAIINQHKNSPHSNIDILDFEKYLSNKKSQDFEGVWKYGLYQIAIKKTDSGYIGILINDVLPYWQKGQIKLEIKKQEKQFDGIVYMKDHSMSKSNNVSLIGQNYLTIADDITLTRLSPKLPTEEDVLAYFKSMNAQTPYMEFLDTKTLYFRIPSFESQQKRFIDSVINANKENLSKTLNLIIDIRQNGGGSSLSYKEIIPYLYTNPIRTPEIDYLSTPLNNQRMLDIMNKPELGATDEIKKGAKKGYEKLQKHLGEFVSDIEENSNENGIIIDFLQSTKLYPKKVAIIIDEGDGSAAEQFLLAAKQSKKVKLFGTTTFGADDIANVNRVNFPCNEYELVYAISKSKRIPDFIVDDRGIQPDYYIDNSIPKNKWVAFVKNILEQ